MIAAQRLYPDAAMVFPGGQERTLREFFLKSAQYAFDFQKLRDIDLDRVERLILVDVRQSSAIGPLDKLSRRPGMALHIYDHHPDSPGGPARRGRTSPRRRLDRHGASPISSWSAGWCRAPMKRP